MLRLAMSRLRLSVRVRRDLLAGVLLPVAVLAGPLHADPPATPAEPQPFLRATSDAEGRRTLELASRSYRRPDGTGPTVMLVGAVHIADA